MKLLLPLLFAPISLVAQNPIVPVLLNQIPDFSESMTSTSRVIDLDQYFGVAEVEDEVVRWTATYDVAGETQTGVMDFLLFRNLTPVTKANFLGYVERGDYVKNFIHRTVPGFVIQGGGFLADVRDDGLVSFGEIETQPTIINEFCVSNTLGTISMAKLGGDPDSATSQWFVSVAENSDNLDFQNGGFTVFGRLTQETLAEALKVNNQDKFLLANFGGAFGSVPLEKASKQETLNIDDFYRFDSIEKVAIPDGQVGTERALTYRLVSQEGSDSIEGNLENSKLTITYSGIEDDDERDFVVEVEDSVGNVVRDTFLVEFPDQELTSFADWRAENFSGDDLADDSVSGPDGDHNGDGISNFQVFFQGFTLDQYLPKTIDQMTLVPGANQVKLTMKRRKKISGARYLIEQSPDLANWKATPVTEAVESDPFEDFETLTLTVARNLTNFPKSFFRVRFTQD